MLKHIPFYASLLDRPLKDGNKSKASHVLVYGAIEAHAMGANGKCTASNALIAAETGLQQTSVATIISALSRSGWVQVSLNENNQRTGIDPCMVIEPPLNHHLTPLKPPFNIYNNKGNSKEEDTSSQASDLFGLEATGKASQGNANSVPRADARGDVLLVFQEVSKILHGKQPIMYSDMRKLKIRKRLQNFKPQEIIKAAENLTHSKFHMGENDGNRKYASLDFLMTNDERVEKWLHETPVKQTKSVF